MLEITRIAVKILIGSKLNGVDKNGYNHHIGTVFAGGVDKRKMPFMQKTHGRHDGDFFSLTLPVHGPFLHFLD